MAGVYRHGNPSGVRHGGHPGRHQYAGAVPPLRHQPQDRLQMAAPLCRRRRGRAGRSLAAAPHRPAGDPAAGGQSGRRCAPGASLVGWPQDPPCLASHPLPRRAGAEHDHAHPRRRRAAARRTGPHRHVAVRAGGPQRSVAARLHGPPPAAPGSGASADAGRRPQPLPAHPDGHRSGGSGHGAGHPDRVFPSVGAAMGDPDRQRLALGA